MIQHPFRVRKQLKVYCKIVKNSLSKKSMKLFNVFIDEQLKPVQITWKKFKEIGNKGEFKAFLCGSDQVWNADTMYVDPLYYLRFAPKEKRIAFAPSFGRNRIPKYNRKIIKEYIQDIKWLSVREKSGVDIIRNIVGEKAVWLLDPTLILSADKWKRYLDIKENNLLKEEEYIVAYFLDEPSQSAKQYIQKLAVEDNLLVLALPYERIKDSWFDQTAIAGPKEFLEFINNAKYICTDSFHGTIFSLNFEIPFFVFERQYGMAGKQSTRIQSVLELVNMEERYNPQENLMKKKIDFSHCRNILNRERTVAFAYLRDSIGE
jgi:hypothetical protein